MQAYHIILILVQSSILMAAPSWVPTELANKINTPANSSDDQRILNLIASYETQLEALDTNNNIIKENIFRIQENVIVLYKEYNRNKSRYKSADFSASSCMDWMEIDMTFQFAFLSQGQDPRQQMAGKYLQKAYWVDSSYFIDAPYGSIMSKYDFRVADNYNPNTPSPLYVSNQDSPDDGALKSAGYSMIRNYHIPYEFQLVRNGAKVRAAIIDASKDLNINPFRIYSTGFSFGGKVSYNMAWNNVHWFAAILPLNADLREADSYFYEDVAFLQNVPVQITHGLGDDFRSDGEKIFNLMQANGNHVFWLDVPGGHNADAVFRGDLSLFTDFSDKYTMHPYPKEVTHFVECNKWSMAFWVNAYFPQEVGCGADAVYKIKVEGNTINILQAEDPITALDFRLNDFLVDMNNNVSVMYNGSSLYEGPAEDTIKVTIRPGNQVRSNGEKIPLWAEVDSIQKAVFGYTNTIADNWQPYAPTDPSSVKKIINKEKQQGLHVYPNPFNPRLVIQLPAINETGNKKIQLFNMNGQKVTQWNLSRQRKIVWEARNQPTGVYQLVYEYGDVRMLKKIVLKK